MRILIVFVFAFVLVSSCKNDKKNDHTTETSPRKDTIVAPPGDSVNRDTLKVHNYSWTKKDKDRFLLECKNGSREHLSEEKLKDFCSCMLTQAQKYYSDYTEMDKRGNDESDGKILEACAGYLDEEEDQ